jgi:DNA repair protein RecO (recombination protein O)
MPIGDYDKRLIILTKEKGKITAFAKGARKPGSAFLACSQPFSFGEFTLYEGRSSYNVMAVDIKNYFEELGRDLEGAYYGFYFCELSDYLTHENEDGSNTLKLLYQSLRALGQENINNRLVRRIFELRMLLISGVVPQVFTCVKCNKPEELYFFNIENGGIVCKDCHKNMGKSVHISESALYAMQYIITSPLEKLYTFKVTNEVMDELKTCIGDYANTYFEKRMKSLDLLEKLF